MRTLEVILILLLLFIGWFINQLYDFPCGKLMNVPLPTLINRTEKIYPKCEDKIKECSVEVYKYPLTSTVPFNTINCNANIQFLNCLKKKGCKVNLKTLKD
jgi:hypothetical protein